LRFAFGRARAGGFLCVFAVGGDLFFGWHKWVLPVIDVAQGVKIFGAELGGILGE
jgi:hypothetical protein